MKQIEDFPDYSVTEDGQVWSNKTSVPKLMKQQIDVHGYLVVKISNTNKTKTAFVHRLVAKAYIPNPDNLPCVCHKDDNPTNTHRDNLFWGTHNDNMVDKRSKGRAAKKLTPENIRELRNTPKYTGMFNDFAKKWGANRQSIAAAYYRRTWKHIQ